MTSQYKPFSQVVIIGCGDIGLRVARLWESEHLPLVGVGRTESTRDRCDSLNISFQQVDLDRPLAASCLDLSDALVYYFAPPPPSGDTDPRMAHFLAAIGEQKPARLILLSTSGVYGNQQGERVSEDTPPHPEVDRSRRRYDMECQLRHWSEQHAVPVVILRVGGIYGPGRLPLERIKKGIPMLHEHLAPQTNRIHADDLAQVCFNAALYGREGEVYNVSDGQDSNMTEYFLTIADHFGLPHPPLVDWDEAEKTISAGMLSYLRESRRMDNSKMMKELRVTLKYPDLKSGLLSCKEE